MGGSRLFRAYCARSVCALHVGLEGTVLRSHRRLGHVADEHIQLRLTKVNSSEIEFSLHLFNMVRLIEFRL